MMKMKMIAAAIAPELELVTGGCRTVLLKLSTSKTTHGGKSVAGFFAAGLPTVASVMQMLSIPLDTSGSLNDTVVKTRYSGKN